jgi:tartrate dehydratase beta subunit/fumarate hydratase class I family protein
MEITEWWPKLDQETQAWLVSHNGESLPQEILTKIVAAGGSVSPDEWWVGAAGPTGFSLSDRAVDWLESVANGESG